MLSEKAQQPISCDGSIDMRASEGSLRANCFAFGVKQVQLRLKAYPHFVADAFKGFPGRSRLIRSRLLDQQHGADILEGGDDLLPNLHPDGAQPGIGSALLVSRLGNLA